MTRPALGHSPLARPAPPVTHALQLLAPGPGRRLRRLLGHLAGTLSGYSDGTLERLFGSHVHELLTALAADQRIERDGAERSAGGSLRAGGRWRGGSEVSGEAH